MAKFQTRGIRPSQMPADARLRALQSGVPRQGFVVSAIASCSILLLFFRVFPVANYWVTVGSLLAVVIFALSLRIFSWQNFALPALTLAAWPLLTFVGAQITGAQIAPLPSEFLQSYALWCVTLALVAAGLTTRSAPSLPAHRIAYVILAVACVQVLMAGLLGSTAAYDILQGPLGFDSKRTYLELVAGWRARAIGLYYEPSMCGLVLGTLAIIDFVQTGRLVRAGAIAFASIVLVKSLGLLILLGLMGCILFAKSWRGFAIIALVSVPVALLEGHQIAERISVGVNDTQTSTIRRTIAPLNTIGYSLIHYPLGIPVGSNEIISATTGYYRETGEPKITNGTYELLLYFGFPGILALFLSVGYGLQCFLQGRREMTAAVAYLMLATAISGSYLSIECGLLMFFFASTCVAADRRRLVARVVPSLPSPRELIGSPRQRRLAQASSKLFEKDFK